jgi:spore germination cell wall hydrolase CwlJ-like protein
MTDDDLLALCVWDEAQGEPQDGRAAVARVVLNRMAARYRSDGTVAGTVLAYDQFSGFWFEMKDGVYRRVCHTLEEAQARAALLLRRAEANVAVFSECRAAAQGVRAGTYEGAAYDALSDAAVLYLNPRIAKAAWATPDKHLCDIGRHSFFRA